MSIAESLYKKILLNLMPTEEEKREFGITTYKHYFVYSTLICKGLLCLDELNYISGNGYHITEFLTKIRHNPHPELVYTTGWDNEYESDAESQPDSIS
mgnify:CR=1 FL=1